MKLKDFRKDAHSFTEKLSNINRNLAFAGIAIIWVFKIQEKQNIIIPRDLLIPLYFIIISLVLDLSQYLIGSIAWTIFHRYKEKKGIEDETDLKAPRWISNILYFIFFLKVVFNIFAFIFLFIYISKELFN